MRALTVLLAACIATAPVSAQTPAVRIWQGSDPAITEGETVIDGDPADVYATVLDYAKWTDIFPDVAHVNVTSQQQGIDARVTLISPTGHRDNLHFHNQPAARLIFFEDTGNGGRAEVWGEIVFIADQPGTTRVHIRLYADVKGIATLVVSDGTVRKQRETKIERDLAHIHSYFRRQ